jgi:purine-binding chemotaxis protein CheW
LKFKKEAVEYDDRTCIVVVDISQIPIGLIVDNVNEVMNISDEDIAPPPDARASFDNKYIKGIGKSEGAVQLLLDCEKLLMTEELASMEAL